MRRVVVQETRKFDGIFIGNSVQEYVETKIICQLEKY